MEDLVKDSLGGAKDFLPDRWIDKVAKTVNTGYRKIRPIHGYIGSSGAGMTIFGCQAILLARNSICRWINFFSTKDVVLEHEEAHRLGEVANRRRVITNMNKSIFFILYELLTLFDLSNGFICIYNEYKQLSPIKVVNASDHKSLLNKVEAFWQISSVAHASHLQGAVYGAAFGIVFGAIMPSLQRMRIKCMRL